MTSRWGSPWKGICSLPAKAAGIYPQQLAYVYHLPGERGRLPAAKNRVYFRSEAEAREAGYHPARSRRASAPRRVLNRLGGKTTPPPPPFGAQQPNTAPTAPAPNQ
jgi:hypothetical protein